MQVTTMTESRYKAREKYAEYLRGLKMRHSAEYEAAKNAYRELSRGRQVIDLVETMRAAGVDAQHRPRLAIVRADARLCWYRSRSLRRPYPYFSMEATSVFDKPGPRRVELPVGVFPRHSPGSTTREVSCRAVVPSIPPSVLPAGKLTRFHILWEAEWENMPVDPLLLKSLGQGLYVVLAQWDLTDVERAVLASSQIRS